MKKIVRIGLWAATLSAALWLSACGGGGGGGSTSGGGGTIGSSGPIDTSAAYPDPSIPASRSANICDAGTQKQFIRSYFNEMYLWFDEVPQADASRLDVENYFYGLRVRTPDSSGKPRDRFSFIVPQAEADSFSTGEGYLYGMQWARDAQGRIRVAYVIPGSPAEQAGMARGGQLLSVVSSTSDSWEPNAPNASVTFNYADLPGQPGRQITLVAAKLQENPVPLTTQVISPNGRRMGYILFNSHTLGAQDRLIDAVKSLSGSGIQDLVLDLRYNSGGYLYIANTLASMITGPANDGKVFERLQFNSKRTAESMSYVSRLGGKVVFGEFLYPKDTPLPRLALQRLYVLASGSTCSASESVINALRGVDVEVILVGQTTCGKPYGFTREDNCGWALYPIEFQGYNAKNFGDYPGGFSPSCAASDDFDHGLGTPVEGQLGVALRHADLGSCPVTPANARLASSQVPLDGPRLNLHRDKPGRLLLDTPKR